MAITHIFFDLDGTLVHSFPGIAFSANAAVSQVFPDMTPPDFLPFIGPPIREIFRQALHEEDPEKLLLLEQAFRKSYDSEGWTKTTAFPGVAKTLGSLRESNITCFVLTNKPYRPTQAILRHLGLETFFASVFTPDTRTPHFISKVEAALDARDQIGLPASKGLVVGDSMDDAAAAEACGFQFAAATFGYGTAHLQKRHAVHYRLARFDGLLGSPLSDQILQSSSAS